MSDHVLCGWRVRSEIALPELHRWRGADDAPVNLTIRAGTVPDVLRDPVYTSHLLQVDRDGACRHHVPDVAVFHLDASAQVITVATKLPLDAPAIRTFLFGTTFGLLSFKRGYLPLHAACIRIATEHGAEAIALAGPSGVGKSTLAAAFSRAGYQVLCDDIAVLRIDDDGRVAVLPGLPRIKLWDSSLRALSLPHDGLDKVQPHLQKYILPLDEQPDEAPVHLRTVVHLGWENDRQYTRDEPLRGMDAIIYMAGNVYRQRQLGRLPMRTDGLLARATRAAAGIERHVRITRVQDFAALGGLIDRLIAAEIGVGAE